MRDGARSPPPAPPPAAARPRPIPSPAAPPRVLSAARAQPLAPEPVRPLKERVASEAGNVLLNLVAQLRELVTDFRNRDRYFKYKAGILATWLLLSAASLTVACPSGGLGRSGDLGARLVLAGDAEHPVVTLFNESDEAWTDVTVIVNGRFRAAAAVVSPGSNLTLTPGQLMGADGVVAPSDLRVHTLEIRAEEGDEVLMEDGELR